MAFKQFLKKNKFIILGISVVLVVSVSIGTFFMNKSKSPKDKIEYKIEMTDNVISTKRNGEIYLYKTKDGREVDVFDLKSLSKGKEVIEHEVVPKIDENVKSEYYKGFKKIKTTIKEGDIGWVIQKKLTPNRDIEEMLKLIKEVNKKDNIDLIYPGEEFIFLENPTENQVAEIKDEKIKENEKKVIKKLGEDAVYMYSSSKDFSELYAYNDFEQTFYKISEKNDKIIVSEILKTDKVTDFNSYRVETGNIFVESKDGKSITKLSSNNTIKTMELKGKIDCWEIYKDNIYCIIDKTLYKIDTVSGKETSINLGDKSLSMIVVDGNLYIQNIFGEGNKKSVVYKINSENLDVYGWYELESNINRLYTASINEKNIYISQIQEDEFSTKALLIGVDTSKLKTLEKVDKVKMNPYGFSKNNCLYIPNANNVSILDVNTGREITKVKTKGEINLPID